MSIFGYDDTNKNLKVSSIHSNGANTKKNKIQSVKDNGFNTEEQVLNSLNFIKEIAKPTTKQKEYEQINAPKRPTIVIPPNLQLKKVIIPEGPQEPQLPVLMKSISDQMTKEEKEDYQKNKKLDKDLIRQLTKEEKEYYVSQMNKYISKYNSYLIAKKKFDDEKPTIENILKKISKNTKIYDSSNQLNTLILNIQTVQEYINTNIIKNDNTIIVGYKEGLEQFKKNTATKAVDDYKKTMQSVDLGAVINTIDNFHKKHEEIIQNIEKYIKDKSTVDITEIHNYMQENLKQINDIESHLLNINKIIQSIFSIKNLYIKNTGVLRESAYMINGLNDIIQDNIEAKDVNANGIINSYLVTANMYINSYKESIADIEYIIRSTNTGGKRTISRKRISHKKSKTIRRRKIR
jgi:hypothetical protein